MQHAAGASGAGETIALLGAPRSSVCAYGDVFDIWCWVTLLASVAYCALWAQSATHLQISYVCLWVGGHLAARQSLVVANFLFGRFYMLPHYIGMSEEEIHTFYMFGEIPLEEWLSKFGERRIIVRDGLQRKVPHLLFHFGYIVFWSYAIPSLGIADTLAAGADNSLAQGMVVNHVAWGGVVAAVQLLAVHCHSAIGENVWYYAQAVIFYSPRIRDGNLRWKNMIFVGVGSMWGTVTATALWLLALVPRYHPREYVLCLQLCWIPYAIGDAMAEIVGCLFGRHFFCVTGIGEINKKTYEGVLGMFSSTLFGCIAVIVVADSQGDLVDATLPAWIAMAVVLSIASTLAETWSPRSTDNFTIPLATSIVLIAFAYCR